VIISIQEQHLYVRIVVRSTIQQRGQVFMMVHLERKNVRDAIKTWILGVE